LASHTGNFTISSSGFACAYGLSLIWVTRYSTAGRGCFFLASSSLSLLPLVDSKSCFFCRDYLRSLSLSLRVFFLCSEGFTLIPGRPFRCQHSSQLCPVFLQCLQYLFIAFTCEGFSGFGSAYLLLRQSRP